jgi:hypothetical protein
MVKYSGGGRHKTRRRRRNKTKQRKIRRRAATKKRRHYKKKSIKRRKGKKNQRGGMQILERLTRRTPAPATEEEDEDEEIFSNISFLLSKEGETITVNLLKNNRGYYLKWYGEEEERRGVKKIILTAKQFEFKANKTEGKDPQDVTLYPIEENDDKYFIIKAALLEKGARKVEGETGRYQLQLGNGDALEISVPNEGEVQKQWVEWILGENGDKYPKVKDKMTEALNTGKATLAAAAAAAEAKRIEPFKCATCGEQLFSQEYLDAHIEADHKPAPSFQASDSEAETPSR